MINLNINKNDKILITGAHGFLGKYVVNELCNRGYQNLCIPERGEYGCDLIDNSCDWLYENMAEEYFLRFGPFDGIIHLAATVGGIRANSNSPYDFITENLSMGLNLIGCALHVNQPMAKKFLLMSTTCSYPRDTPTPFKEDTLWNGRPESSNEPYGVAKKTLSLVLDAARRQYGLNGITLIPSNLYGPGDDYDENNSHVIPAIIRKMDQAIQKGEEEVILWGTGKATREFLYVEDCARAVVDAFEKYDEAEPVNIGTGNEFSIEDITKTIAELMGYSGKIIFDCKNPDGQPRRCLDTTKAKELFGFNATTGIYTGLRKTIKSYRETNKCM